VPTDDAPAPGPTRVATPWRSDELRAVGSGDSALPEVFRGLT